LLVEKWPFFALSAVFCGLAIFAQSASKALVSLAHHALDMRLNNAARAYADYLLKTVYPANLAIFYPPQLTISWFALVVAVALLALISVAAWRLRRRLPCLLMGWFWFVGMLVPVIGLVQVGDQLDADRYTYLPSIGLFIAVVFGLAAVVAARRIRVLVWAPVVVLALVGCLWRTTQELGFWQDSETLFARAVVTTRDNFIALNNLGSILLQRGKIDDAIDRLRQAVQIEPGNAKAQNNLGLALVRLGRFDQAEPCYRKAIEVNPRYVQAYENLGFVYLQSGRLREAIATFREVTEIDSSDAKAFNDLGVAYMKSGRVDEGADAFRRAVGLQPTHARFRNNLGNALLQQGRAAEAMGYLER
jgi:Flp pilus assembly protein TadD